MIEVVTDPKLVGLSAEQLEGINRGMKEILGECSRVVVFNSDLQTVAATFEVRSEKLSILHCQVLFQAAFCSQCGSTSPSPPAQPKPAEFKALSVLVDNRDDAVRKGMVLAGTKFEASTEPISRRDLRHGHPLAAVWWVNPRQCPPSPARYTVTIPRWCMVGP